MVFHGVLERLHPLRLPLRASAGRGLIVALLVANLATRVLAHAAPLPAADVPPPPPAMDPAAPLGQVRVGAHKSIQRLPDLDGVTTNAFFAGPTSYGLGGWGGSAVGAQTWSSEARFASDLAAGRIPADVHVVMYDPENWSATPLAERADPESAMRAFAMLARRYGYTVLITPHPSLVDTPGAVCGRNPGETEQHAYLRCGIQGDAASGDVWSSSEEASALASPSTSSLRRLSRALSSVSARPGALAHDLTAVDGVVYIGSQNGELFAYPAQCSTPCEPEWTATVGGPGDWVSPSATAGMVFVGSDRLYALRLTPS